MSDFSKATPRPWRVHECRVYFPQMAGGFSLHNCPEPDAKAARIAELEAENKRLAKSRNRWGQKYNKTLEKLRAAVMTDTEYVKAVDEKCAEMAARIAELEAALTALVKWTPRGECNCQPTGDGFHTCPLCRARAALGKDKG